MKYRISSLILSGLFLCSGLTGSNGSSFVPPQGVSLWAGLDAGLGLLSSAVVGEADKSGTSGSAKLLGSYYRGDWVFEAGGAFFLNSVTGTRANGTQIRVQHTSAYAELGARYLLGPRWEAGLFGALVFGQDLSFRPTVMPLRAEADQSLLVMLGLQGLYRFHFGETSRWLGRVGLRLGTDINIDNRNYLTLQGVLHIGLPIFERAVVSQAPDPVKKSEPIVLPKLNFGLGSERLDPESRAFLVALGKAVSRLDRGCGKMVIEGHTDSSGSPNRNRELSKLRAEQVKSHLVEGGCSAGDLKTQGFGSSRPLMDERASGGAEVNRRVQFVVRERRVSQEFAAEVKRLRQAHGL